MSATKSGTTITWPANDVTTVVLQCGIKELYTTGAIGVRGTQDAAAMRVATEHLQLADVKGFPNVILPEAHTDVLTVTVIPSPHINSLYQTSAVRIMSGGYDA